jgi:hypothetical protein
MENLPALRVGGAASHFFLSPRSANLSSPSFSAGRAG